jgi:hypothetical protein
MPAALELLAGMLEQFNEVIERDALRAAWVYKAVPSRALGQPAL